MEFMVAVINNEGGFYPTELYMYELMKAGAAIHAPCVNNSEYFTNIRDNQVHIGLRRIKSLQEALALQIIEERKRSGPYLHLQDLIERTNIPIEQLNILIRINALRFTGKHKKELLWEANFLQKKNINHVPAHRSLFREGNKEFKLPKLPVYPMEEIYDQIELLGFPLCNPFELVDEDPAKFIKGNELKDHIGRQVTVLGYHITQKHVRTIKGDTMSFGTFLDHEMNWIDAVLFPEVHRNNPIYSGFYSITGRVMEEFSFCSVEASHIKQVSIKKRNTQTV